MEFQDDSALNKGTKEFKMNKKLVEKQLNTNSMEILKTE